MKAEEFKILKSDSIKLNIGGGKGHPQVDGWKVVDIRNHADIVVDISRNPLPFEDNSVSAIFTSHTLEHIIPQRLPHVLTEFYRVMDKQNSILRIIVPDTQKAIKAYLERDHAFFNTSDVTLIDPDAPIGGKLASWLYSTRLDKTTGELADMLGHVNCFDVEYMIFILRKIGFKKVYESQYQKSNLAELRGKAWDRHPMESIFVEAVF
ncbi:MAG: methyltransferase domain-containing protein [Nitrospirae bacterium]|nr:methyltransferase domain-containing protein [Nitrospirota bacterium]